MSSGESNCPSGKIQYRTMAKALKRQDKRYPGQYRRAYRCAECGRWHISTIPLVEVKQIRRAIR